MIYGTKPRVAASGSDCCCKIEFRGYEISIAMDNSCGGMDILGRTDIRVYYKTNDKAILSRGDSRPSSLDGSMALDVTEYFQVCQKASRVIYGEAENLYKIMDQIIHNPPVVDCTEEQKENYRKARLAYIERSKQHLT